jgi:DNA-binding CsgD family transcriptional regulator
VIPRDKGARRPAIESAIPRPRARLDPPAGLEAFRLPDDPQVAVLSWPIAPARKPWTPLSRAEAEVLELLRAGLSNAEIAARRGRSPRTVANQVASIFVKLEVRGRPELFARLAAPHRKRRNE